MGPHGNPKKILRYWQGYWFLLTNRWWGLTDEDNTYISHWTWRSQAGVDLELPPLLISVPGTECTLHTVKAKGKHGSFTYILWFPVLCFYGISLCENMWVSMSVCVASAFSLSLLKYLFVSFVLFWFVCTLSYFIFLDICFPLRESKKGE